MTAKTKATKARGTTANSSLRERGRQVLAMAQKAATESSRWEDYHNAVFGIGGPFATLFPTYEERMAFAKTEEHAQILHILEEVLKRDEERDQAEEAEDSGLPHSDASGRFVLRLPRSVHAALVKEAEAEGVSLNQLCLAKLCTQLRAGIFIKC
jgi:predicted HicB family RNase H-like nuclease